MSIYSRITLTPIRVKLTSARARATALVAAARRSLAEPIVHAIGILATTVAALSALTFVGGCTSPPPPANGAISVTWSISSKSRAVSCEAVGARSVALRLRNRASGNVIATAFPCPNSPGTAQVAAGLYDVSFQLDAADGTRLATAQDETGVSIVAGRLTRLEPVAFEASSQATLVLSLATSATTNCRPASAGGAGITGNTIGLEFVGGGCAAVTFTRRRGAEERGTYMVNCGLPQIAPCIETDETLTASVDPGGYIVRARGKIGALDCWVRDDSIDVPSAGRTVFRTLGLLHATGVCPP